MAQCPHMFGPMYDEDRDGDGPLLCCILEAGHSGPHRSDQITDGWGQIGPAIVRCRFMVAWEADDA